jgi:hypothetical protein
MGVGVLADLIRIVICPQVLIVEFPDANASTSCVVREERVGRKERLSSTRLQGPLKKLAVLQDNLVGRGLAPIEGVKDTGVPDGDASNRRVGSAFCSSHSIRQYYVGFCVPSLLYELHFDSFPRVQSALQHIQSDLTVSVHLKITRQKGEQRINDHPVFMFRIFFVPLLAIRKH